jgi:hypothetical protein
MPVAKSRRRQSARRERRNAPRADRDSLAACRELDLSSNHLASFYFKNTVLRA